MKVQVRFHGLHHSKALEEHALRRVHSQLSRFCHEIRLTHLRFTGVKSRGADEKRCQIIVRGPKLGELHVTETSETAYAAVDGAVKRMSFVVGSELERFRARRSRRLPAAANIAS